MPEYFLKVLLPITGLCAVVLIIIAATTPTVRNWAFVKACVSAYFQALLGVHLTAFFLFGPFVIMSWISGPPK